MAKIQRLDSALVDQIAAGEVVERPASLAKELVENALDAGATRVRIDIEAGGTTLVRVSDDGEGMSAEDALLAIERHATSKITQFDDLHRLHTFGFRGEALPSIASVSRLTLSTRQRGAAEGLEIVVEGGAKPVVKPAGRAEGTTVEVRDLFFNVPARRKFLKASATESAHVGEVVMLAALARHDVTFTLTRDGKPAREYLRSASRLERVKQVLAQEPRLEACLGERGPMRIEAYLSPPERARTGAQALHLFVNGRPIKDRPLARAVAHAYGSVLDGGRYPVGVVYLELPPEIVDVNVHPQKAEVRFEDGRAVFDAVTRELFAALAKAFAIPAVGPAGRPWMGSGGGIATGGFGGGGAYFGTGVGAREGAGAGEPRSGSVTGSVTGSMVDEAPVTLSERQESFGRSGFYGRLRFLAQVRNMFLLCEGEDGLYVLDQHAADERRNFERLRRGFRERSVAMQQLLVPEVVELMPNEVALFTEHEGELAGMGLEVRAVGPHSVAVHGVPRILARARPERLVRDLLAEVGRVGGRSFQGAIDLSLATMACHGSVRAGAAMSAEEAQALLKALDDVDFAGHCPHGRPVVMRLPFGELERRVGR